MKCLTNEQIQGLIDGEAPPLNPNELQHFNSCERCQKIYNEQKNVAQSIKNLLNEVAKSPTEIPEFKVPDSINISKSKKRRFPIWLKVAAILIPVCFVWKISNKKEDGNFKPSAENIQMYEMCNSVDANTAFQENIIITKVTDDKGNTIEY